MSGMMPTGILIVWLEGAASNWTKCTVLWLPVCTPQATSFSHLMLFYVEVGCHLFPFSKYGKNLPVTGLQPSTRCKANKRPQVDSLESSFNHDGP